MTSIRTAPGLARLRVLEFGDMVSAPYATKLLADVGAQVIKVEGPDGDPARHRGPYCGDPDPDASGLFLALNTNKRSIVVTPETSERLDSLLATADVVVTNWRPSRLAELGVDLDALVAERPELVVCSVTPFGLTGPYADFAAVELTVSHAGGWAYQCPGTSDEPDAPPLKVFGHQCDFQAGMAAAMATLATVYRAETTGIGDFLDFSAMSHIAGLLEAAFIAGSYMGENPNRLGSRLLNPWGIYPCSDGLIFMVCVEQDQWERLVELMGTPEWTQLGLFDTLAQRLENEDLLLLYLSEWTSTQKVDELWHAGQAHRICFAPVFTMADMEQQPHLHERQFLVDVDHPRAGSVKHLGPPFQASSGLWGPLTAAPLLDAAAVPAFLAPSRPTSSPSPSLPSSSAPRFPAAGSPEGQAGEKSAVARPLDGVRVIDLTWVWAGPYCTMHLANLGADVVKIESSTRPDLGRRLALHPNDGTEPTLNTSAYMNQWGQGKRSCELDLSEPANIATLKKLIAGADVVVENFATGVMDRLGLSYDELRQINPSLIVASISGYGSTGPLSSYMGYGPTTGPMSGLTSLTGYSDGKPQELGVSIGDPGAGITAAFALCAALVDRIESDAGSYLDVALWESTAANAVEGWMHHTLAGSEPQRMGNRDPLMAPHNCYRAAGEDDWVSIACPDDAAWARLAAAIDPDLVVDERFVTAVLRKRNEDALDAIVTTWTQSLDRWEVTRKLQASAIAAFPSMSPLDLLDDPHLAERNFIEYLEHPEVGKRAHTGVPWRSATGPNGVPRRAPLLGEHTAEVLAEII
jgi:crotonobetainyl-CoA:carnitine CoA-transferase CaiB-like acyl-CoA transferase